VSRFHFLALKYIVSFVRMDFGFASIPQCSACQDVTQRQLWTVCCSERSAWTPQNIADDRRSLQITADHLNVTADHLCLICLNSTPQITANERFRLGLGLGLGIYRVRWSVVISGHLRWSAVFRQIKHRWSAVMFRWSAVICGDLRCSGRPVQNAE